MAITRINVGTLANDGTGDELRQAFVKVNNNFDDLDARVQNQATAGNLGAGTGIFYSKESGVIGLKSLVAGTNIEITSDNDTITISNEGTIIIQGNSGQGTVTGPGRTMIFQGDQNINATALGNTVSFSLTGNSLVVQDTSPALGGNLDAGAFDITNADVIVANEFRGALIGTVDGVNITELRNATANMFGFDFGTITVNLVKGLDYLISQTTIDYGSFITPASLNSDYGNIV